jgi:hypothetical protein
VNIQALLASMPPATTTMITTLCRHPPHRHHTFAAGVLSDVFVLLVVRQLPPVNIQALLASMPPAPAAMATGSQLVNGVLVRRRIHRFFRCLFFGGLGLDAPAPPASDRGSQIIMTVPVRRAPLNTPFAWRGRFLEPVDHHYHPRHAHLFSNLLESAHDGCGMLVCVCQVNPQLLRQARRLYVGNVPPGATEVRAAGGGSCGCG